MRGLSRLQKIPQRGCFLLVFIGVSFCSACGGSSTDWTPAASSAAGANNQGASTSPAASITPSVSSVTLKRTSATALQALATTADTTITKWCFRTDGATPTATDACFKTETQQNIEYTLPSTPSVVTVLAFSLDKNDKVNRVNQLQLYSCSANALQIVQTEPKTISTLGTADKTKVLPTVCVITSVGELVLAIDSTMAPISAANFLKYVEAGFYNGLTFHRILSGSTYSVAQAGGFYVSGTAGSSVYTKKTAAYSSISMESPAITGLSNLTYSLSMARSTDLNSAGSEFFINLTDNNGNWDSAPYAVFGRVIFQDTSSLTALTLAEFRKFSQAGLDGSTKYTLISSTVMSGEMSMPSTPVFIYSAYRMK